MEDKDEPYGGRAPFQADSDTSESGADDIEPFRNELQRRVYEFIVARGGATIREIIDGTGLCWGTVCGRQGELKGLGLICDGGERRVHPTSGSPGTVWVPGDGRRGPARRNRLDEAQMRIRVLEEENERLRGELEKVQQGAQLGLPWRPR